MFTVGYWEIVLTLGLYAIGEWLDQNVIGVPQKCYRIVTRENLTGLISYNTKSKKWYFDAG